MIIIRLLNETTVRLSLYNDNSIACFATIENNFNKMLFSMKEYEKMKIPLIKSVKF